MWSLRGGKLPVSGLSHCVDGGFIYWKRILERGKEREKKIEGETYRETETETEGEERRGKEKRGEENHQGSARKVITAGDTSFAIGEIWF